MNSVGCAATERDIYCIVEVSIVFEQALLYAPLYHIINTHITWWDILFVLSGFDMSVLQLSVTITRCCHFPLYTFIPHVVSGSGQAALKKHLGGHNKTLTHIIHGVQYGVITLRHYLLYFHLSIPCARFRLLHFIAARWSRHLKATLLQCSSQPSLLLQTLLYFRPWCHLVSRVAIRFC